MNKKKLCASIISCLTFLTPCIYSYADSTPGYITNDQAWSNLVAKQFQEAGERIGKTFWYTPTKIIPDLSPLYGNVEIQYAMVQGESKFQPIKPEQFTITGLVKAPHGIADDSAYQIKFASGKVGYIKISALSMALQEVPDARKLENAYSPFITTESPSVIIDRAAAKKIKDDQDVREIVAKIDADIKTKGGVRIGMTKKQVLNSYWGKPESVNKTIYRYGTHEQWVYSEGRYLYFENGRLTSIQNQD